jgi:hypothetical protein
MRETLATRRRACGQSNLSGVHDIAMRTQAGEHLVEHAPERWLRSQNSSTSATSSAAVLDPASTGFASPRSSTFTAPSCLILMFAGLRSRWTTRCPRAIPLPEVPTLDEFHSIKTSQSMTRTILSAFPDDFSSVPFSPQRGMTGVVSLGQLRLIGFVDTLAPSGGVHPPQEEKPWLMLLEPLGFPRCPARSAS